MNRATEQGDAADEAFGGTVTRQKCRLMPAPVDVGPGHRFVIFTKRLRDGVRRGDITCSVRIWRRPHVIAGKRYRMEEGEIEVDSVLHGRRGLAQGREARAGRERVPREVPLPSTGGGVASAEARQARWSLTTAAKEKPIG